MSDTSLYDDDFIAWTEEQAEALRALARRPELTNAVDWENVIEEIESLGRSQVKAVQSRLVWIMAHLIKFLSDPYAPSLRLWRSEVVSLQQAAAADYAASMRQLIDMDKLWRRACREAAAALDEYGRRPSRSLPEECPFNLDELVAEEFSLDAAVEQLGRALDNRR